MNQNTKKQSYKDWLDDVNSAIFTKLDYDADESYNRESFKKYEAELKDEFDGGVDAWSAAETIIGFQEAEKIRKH